MDSFYAIQDATVFWSNITKHLESAFLIYSKESWSTKSSYFFLGGLDLLVQTKHVGQAGWYRT